MERMAVDLQAQRAEVDGLEQFLGHIRKTPLKARIEQASAMISQMCKESRPPKMSIPAQPTDEDVFIVAALEDAARVCQLAVEYLDAEREYRIEHDKQQAGIGVTLKADRAESALRSALGMKPIDSEAARLASDDE